MIQRRRHLEELEPDGIQLLKLAEHAANRVEHHALGLALSNGALQPHLKAAEIVVAHGQCIVVLLRNIHKYSFVVALLGINASVQDAQVDTDILHLFLNRDEYPRLAKQLNAP